MCSFSGVVKNSHCAGGPSVTGTAGEESGVGSETTSGELTVAVEVVSRVWAPPAGRSPREGGEEKLAGGIPVRKGKLTVRGLRGGPLSAMGTTRMEERMGCERTT